MTRFIVPLLACSLLGCFQSNLPDPRPVPPPDGGYDDSEPPALEETTSGLTYGNPYATQGIDMPVAMGSFSCTHWLWGTFANDVTGGFELVPLPTVPGDPGVRHFRAVWHGTTWSQPGIRTATTLDGSVEVKESGFGDLRNSSATCESCYSTGPWPSAGPYYYAGNNAFPWNSPQGQAHIDAWDVTVYPTTYGGRGWVIAHMYPQLSGWSCTRLDMAWQRNDPAPGGGSGGTCPGGPC